MRFDITMVGHISRDTLVYMDEETTGTGGAVFYSSIAGSRSGKKINVVTLAAPADESELDVMRKNGVMVTRLASAKTTAIRINYFTPDRERREVLLEAQADPFSIREFPEIESRIYHLAGLFRGEIPDEFIPFFCRKRGCGRGCPGGTALQ